MLRVKGNKIDRGWMSLKIEQLKLFFKEKYLRWRKIKFKNKLFSLFYTIDSNCTKILNEIWYKSKKYISNYLKKKWLKTV